MLNISRKVLSGAIHCDVPATVGPRKIPPSVPAICKWESSEWRVVAVRRASHHSELSRYAPPLETDSYRISVSAFRYCEVFSKVAGFSLCRTIFKAIADMSDGILQLKGKSRRHDLFQAVENRLRYPSFAAFQYSN
jgi:hypothetical protein